MIRIREAAKKSSSTNGLVIKGVGKGRAIKEKNTFFKNKKSSDGHYARGGGGRGYATLIQNWTGLHGLARMEELF